MTQARYRKLVAAFVVLAYVYSVAMLYVVTESVPAALGLAVWTNLAVCWWLGWALMHESKGKAHHDVVLAVGAILAVALVCFQVLALVAVHKSSTGGLAYVTGPFVMLFGTIVATCIGGAVARNSAAIRAAAEREAEDDPQAGEA